MPTPPLRAVFLSCLLACRGGDKADGDDDDVVGDDDDDDDDTTPGDDDDDDVCEVVGQDGGWSTADFGLGLVDSPVAVAAVGGVVHVAWPGDQIFYVTGGGDTWTPSLPPIVFTGTRSLSLAVDGDGGPHVVYGGQGGTLTHAFLAGSAWTTEALPSFFSVGEGTAVGFDAAGTMHVAYQDGLNTGLNYGNDATGTFTEDFVPDGGYWGGYDPRLAIDGAGVAHLGHRELRSDFTSRLRYAAFDGAAWTEDVVADDADTGHWADIAVAADGTVVLAYFDAAGQRLVVSTGGPGAWRHEAVARAQIPAYGLGVGVLADGTPVVAWVDGRRLNVAAGGVYGFAPHVLDVATPDSVLGVDVDEAGVVHTVRAEFLGSLTYVAYGFPDGVDQDCDQVIDDRSGLDPAAATADLDAADATELCTWNADLGATAPGWCVGVFDSVEDCAGRAAFCGTVGAFEDCSLAATVQCGARSLPTACEACDSGLGGDTPLSSLSVTDWEQLCTWSLAMAGGPGRQHDCGGSGTVTLDTVAECATDNEAALGDCPLTVDQMEACSMAIAADPCEGYLSPACGALAACL